jgi:hypothetical protein
MDVKGVYYKLGEGNIKGSMVRLRWRPEAERALQVLLKPTLTHGRADPGDSHPIMNKWGGA